MTGIPELALKGLGGLLGAGLGYADAKSQEGKKAGGAPDTLEDIKKFRETMTGPPTAPQNLGGALGLLGRRQNFQVPSSSQQYIANLLSNPINNKGPQVNNPYSNIFDPKFWS